MYVFPFGFTFLQNVYIYHSILLIHRKWKIWSHFSKKLNGKLHFLCSLRGYRIKEVLKKTKKKLLR